MAKFEISATYHYAGEIEADTEEAALSEFYGNLNMFYSHAFEELITEIPVCETCDQVAGKDCECEECECGPCNS